MTKNDNDIHVDMVDKADLIKTKVRQHLVRISQNATDSPTPRPQNFKNFTRKGNRDGAI